MKRGRTMFKKMGSLFLSISMILALASCGSSNSSSSASGSAASNSSTAAASGATTTDFTPVKLKFANQHSTDTIANQLDQEICDRIKEATEGRVTVDLYSDSSLGDYTSIFEEVMIGTIDMAHISPVETYDSRVSATMLPYLAFTYDELLSAYAKDGYLYGQLNEALDGLGIKLMGVFCEGFNGIGSMVELTDPAKPGAEKGAIIRSPMMDVYSLCLQNMGFRVSSMPYSDTYTAMQTGVVAGLAGGTAQVNYLTFRDLIKYYYDYRYIQEATMIMINDQLWNSLLPQDQEAISEIINSTCTKATTMAEDANNQYIEKLKSENITVVEFTDEELSAYAESCRENVWPKLANNYPADFLKNVQASLN